MDRIRFALLQARKSEDPARAEEHAAFAARLGVPVDAVRPVDIFSRRLGPDLLKEVDVLLVGGAGEYSVLDDNPYIQHFISLLGRAADDGFPTFASCFGFQAMILALGGEIISDGDNAEVGSYVLETTPDADNDPLFSTMPRTFIAQLGHKDRATVLPKDAVLLARSQKCPIQAIRIPGKPIYATQFHPELTWEDNRLRFIRYMPIYGKLFGEEKAQERLDSHRPGPEANQLIRRFVDEVLGAQRPAQHPEDGEGT